MGQYHLNLHVLGLNNYSTFAEMMKGYRSMARIFHPDNNYGFDTTEIIAMINTARDRLRYQLRENNELREEERVQAAEDESSIPSDHNPDSKSSGTSSEPAPSHLKCNLLIVFKTFLDVHGRGCDDAGSDDVPLDSESGL